LNKFDYKKARENAEKMLEVIERDPQIILTNWSNSIVGLIPGFFALGILGIGIAVTYSSLRQAGIVHSQQNKLEGHADAKAFSNNLPLFHASAGF
jgi:hypothetical protein